MTQSVTPVDLKKYLSKLANKLLADNPELKDQPGLIDKVIQDTTQLIRFKEQHSKTAITPKQLMDPDFINQLSVTIISQAVMQGSEEQKKLIEELTNVLNDLKTSKTYQSELRAAIQEQEALLNEINDILNELTEIMSMNPEALDKIQQKLKKKLQKHLHKKLLKRLEAIIALRLNPNNKEALRDLLRKLINEIKANIESLKKNKHADKTLRPIKDDIYVNLFGLLNSYITGSIAVPLMTYIGNGLGFNDWNPYHGYANIDKINEINFMFGDSLGMEADTLKHFFELEDTEVNELVDLLRAEGIEPTKPAPNPFDMKNQPK
ncbi:MAG TPA: hypothetical protein VL360_01260 [Gammaproteobacteria bacterium]|jgi:hypothetical protein|nr:hypothetical protein [Gammaproteobacteria bacterium]